MTERNNRIEFGMAHTSKALKHIHTRAQIVEPSRNQRICIWICVPHKYTHILMYTYMKKKTTTTTTQPRQSSNPTQYTCTHNMRTKCSNAHSSNNDNVLSYIAHTLDNFHKKKKNLFFPVSFLPLAQLLKLSWMNIIILKCCLNLLNFMEITAKYKWPIVLQRYVFFFFRSG